MWVGVIFVINVVEDFAKLVDSEVMGKVKENRKLFF